MGSERPNDVLAGELRLVRDAAAGDGEARRTLVLKLMNRVRNVARYVTGSDADADDAAQAAMIEILRSIGQYRGEGPLAGWTTKIAARVAIAFARRKRHDDRVLGDLSPRMDSRQDAAGPGASSPLVRERLARCLDRLPDERKETVVLRLVLGCTLDEIARLTGVSRNTAKDRLRVGRQELRQAVLEDPVLCDVLGKGAP